MKIGILAFVGLTIFTFMWSSVYHDKPGKPGISWVDGPYVFYKKNGYYSISGEVRKKRFRYKRENISRSDNTSFDVFYGDKGDSFSVEIMPSHAIPDDHYDEQPKVFTISDLEGNWEYFTSLLVVHDVIDDQLNWKYGTGHLVILGDIFDRGNHVTQILWLIYKLEQEARASGGNVHVILGNHETMTLSGDNRYVHKNYNIVTSSLRKGYNELYSDDSVLGDWLRSKNAIEVIGRTIFVHGGLSPLLSQKALSITGINNIVRSVADVPYGEGMSPTQALIMGVEGPLWNRKYVSKEIKHSDLQQLLYYYQGDEIIIGHTLVPEVSKLYEGSVFAIDVDYRINPLYEALLLEEGVFYKVDSKGRKQAL